MWYIEASLVVETKLTAIIACSTEEIAASSSSAEHSINSEPGDAVPVTAEDSTAEEALPGTSTLPRQGQPEVEGSVTTRDVVV